MKNGLEEPLLLFIKYLLTFVIYRISVDCWSLCDKMEVHFGFAVAYKSYSVTAGTFDDVKAFVKRLEEPFLLFMIMPIDGTFAGVYNSNTARILSRTADVASAILFLPRGELDY